MCEHFKLNNIKFVELTKKLKIYIFHSLQKKGRRKNTRARITRAKKTKTCLHRQAKKKFTRNIQTKQET